MEQILSHLIYHLSSSFQQNNNLKTKNSFHRHFKQSNVEDEYMNVALPPSNFCSSDQTPVTIKTYLLEHVSTSENFRLLQHGSHYSCYYLNNQS